MFTLKYQIKVPLSPLVLIGGFGVFTLTYAQSTEEQVHGKPSELFHGALIESKRENKQPSFPYAAALPVRSSDSEGMM